MVALHDMHCHLDFMTNAEEVASEASAAKTLLFANTVTPEGWLAARERFACFDNVAVGFGMHPWWIADAPSVEHVPRQAESQRAEHRRLANEAAQAAQAKGPDTATDKAKTRRDELLSLLREYDPAIIGEIGLDFGWRHQASRRDQLDMLASIANWIADRRDRLVSLHAIKAARETLDVLEHAGALGRSCCVFHWFSGSSDQLKRAIDAGCYFSCGSRMLATGKGREYVKAIPIDRLLLETDAPAERDTPYSFESLHADLEHVAASIAAIKGEAALDAIAQTTEQLLRYRTVSSS